MGLSAVDYASWTKEQLIERLVSLEADRPAVSAQRTSRPRPNDRFVFSDHPRRKIALRFAYSGEHFSGLAMQPAGSTALPTVESAIFDALAETRLIDPTTAKEGCDWAACGRTDKGVSSAGQVVSLWVRSALRPRRSKSRIQAYGTNGEMEESVEESLVEEKRREIQYAITLNRILPASIRILAWAPVSREFSARFSCKYRHYKYFFNPKHLNLEAMQEAVSHLLGEHDFRNLCKLDPSKQLDTFVRKILRAEISKAKDELYVLDLVGTAFLYNQVRHIMAVLFLVGGGFEQSSIILDLLNIEQVTAKPIYQMADPRPLVLWDCGYDGADVQWHPTIDEEGPSAAAGKLEDRVLWQLTNIRERALIANAIDGLFLQAALSIGHDLPPNPLESIITLGGAAYRRSGKYTPLLQRARLPLVADANERWKLGKGARREAKRRDEHGVLYPPARDEHQSILSSNLSL